MKKIRNRYYIIAVMMITLIYIIGNAISIWNYADVDETRTADVAIVLGAAASGEEVSPVFRERIHQGILLYKNGYANKLIITGGRSDGNEYSDAYIGKQYAIMQGIPEEAILIEEESTITEENLDNAKLLMDREGYTSALIVSDPLHMKRAMRMARDKDIKAYTSPTKTSMYQSLRTKIQFLAREVFFYIGYKIVNLI